MKEYYVEVTYVKKAIVKIEAEYDADALDEVEHLYKSEPEANDDNVFAKWIAERYNQILNYTDENGKKHVYKRSGYENIDK